jgi:trk system potassium uptake protein TrkA
MKKRQYAVIGLGTFGYNVACELAKHNLQVLAIDNQEDIVNDISRFVASAIIADASEQKALEQIGVGDCDSVIIAIGGSVETSIMVTLIVKELGVKDITVKSISQWHSKVAAKLGATRVIYPELETAKKFVNSIVAPNILEQIGLSKDYDLIETVAPKNCWNKAIKDTDIRSKFGINIIAVRRPVPFITEDGQSDIKEEINMVPSPDYEIKQNDILVAIGSIKSLEKLKE